MNQTRTRCHAAAGHSLPEAVIAVSLVGVMFISLYAGFSSGFAILRAARENIRATEILNQQTERLRLLNWNQVLDASHFLPPTFVEPLNPEDPAASPDGAVFQGTIETTTPADWPAAYRDRARLITITITWTNSTGSKPIVNRRLVQTCIARYGMQSYVTAP
ncbi:MAG: hypothetical protein U1F83_15045 [Verrucomicrobiota bacterium]